MRTLSLVLLMVACDIGVTNADGEEQCLDDFLADLGDDRTGLEAEAEQRGIDASDLIAELAEGASGVVGTIVDCEASGAMGKLAERTGGTFIQVSNADEGGDAIVDEVDQMPSGSDVMIVLDATCSMSDDLDAVKSRLAAMLDEADSDARFGLVVFRDRNVDDPWFEELSGLVPATNPGLRKALDGVQATGGGDLAESLYDAVSDTLALQPWSSNNRAIIALTDAPSLEPPDADNGLGDVVDQAKADEVVVTPILVNIW